MHGNMGSRGGGRGGHPQRISVDLTGIVSVAEKNDLIILVTAISEKMYRDINRLFDSQQVAPLDDNGDEMHNWLALALTLTQKPEKSFSRPSTSGSGKPARSPTTAYYQSSDMDSGDDQSMTPQLQELKREAIAFFRKWQAALLQRLRDIGVSDIEPEQASWRGRGRGTRSRSRARVGRAARGGGRGVSTLATGPPRIPSNHLDSSLVRLYTPIPNTLWPLAYERRKLFLHIILLVMLSLHDYNANSRILLVNLASSLNLPLRVCHEDETKIAQGLAEAALEVSPERAAAQKEENKLSKRWKFSFGGASGNGNGIAAALTGVGIGTAHSGHGLTSHAASALLGIMSENGLLMGSLFGLNPSKPLDKIVESCLREVQDFSILTLVDGKAEEYRDARGMHPEYRRLGIVIAISGFLVEDTDVASPWECLGAQAEQYVVQWETSAVTSLGGALETVVRSSAWGFAKTEIKEKSIFRCLLDSNWPVSLLKISKIMDNPWSVGMVRAEKVGTILADVIMRHKFHGERSVSLVGYSLASRAIYTCLMVLAERRQFGLVDSVVLIGTPAPAESRVWLTMKSVVTGRLVNVYSEEDYLLGFLYRTSNTQAGIAGLQEIHGANGVENYRVNKLANGHLSYQSLLKDILRDIDWEYADLEGRRD